MTGCLPKSNRHGLTLYEVVLSLAILLGSMAVLGQLIANGSRAATQARLRTSAMLHCQTTMAEVIAGHVPLLPVDGQVLEEDETGQWTWSLEVIGGQGTAPLSAPSGSAVSQSSGPLHPDLLELRVSVSRIAPDRSVVASGSLTRLIRNPQLYVEAAQLAAERAAEMEASE